MSFLDKELSELTLPELQRLIRQEISRVVPPIPKRVLELSDEDNPLVRPLGAVGAEALVFNEETGQWENGKISANSLEADMVLAGSLIAGDPEGGHVEVGIAGPGDDMEGMTGLHAWAPPSAEHPDGQMTFMIDSDTGDIFMHGEMEFGQSLISSEDLIEIHEQPTTWQEPDIRQSRMAGRKATSGSGTASVSWSSATVKGNTLVCAVLLIDEDDTPPTPSNPSGWGSPIANVVRQDGRLVVWRIAASNSRSGTESVTLNDTCYWVIGLLELSGTADLDVAVVTDSGETTTPSTGTSGTTTQTDEIWIGLIGNWADVGSGVMPVSTPDQESPTNGFLLQQTEFGGRDMSSPDFFRQLEQVRLGMYYKTVTATGTASMGVSLDSADDWAGVMLTFKAKAAAVEPPDVGRVRLYAKDVNDDAFLHTMNESGVEGAVVLGKAGEVWRLEVLSLTINIPSVNAHSGDFIDIAVSGMASGDIVLDANTTTWSNSRYLVLRPFPSTNTLRLHYWNSNDATNDPPEQVYNFLWLRRS